MAMGKLGQLGKGLGHLGSLQGAMAPPGYTFLYRADGTPLYGADGRRLVGAIAR